MTEKCRICLSDTYSSGYVNILIKLNNEETVLQSMVKFSSIKVLDIDPLPKSICKICFEKLIQFFLFRDLIVKSDKKLKEKLLNNHTSLQSCLNHKTYSKEIKIKIEENISQNIGDSNSVKCEDGYSDLGQSFECLDDSKFSKNNNTFNPIRNTRTRKSRKPLKVPNCKELNMIKKPKMKRIYECMECKKTFKKADHLNVHRAYKHAEKQFKCQVCEKKFARKYDLAYHSRVHTGERPYTCDICNKAFASSSYFYMHRRIHTGEKRNKCDLCEDAFINSDQLQIHIRQKHTGEKPFLCETCSSAFTSSSALFRHKRDVHEKKELCRLCNKMYSSRVLKDHIRRHKEREEGIKRYICELCGKRFTCGTSRKRHLVIHSGEKAFKCEVCEKAFNQRSTLITHMRIHSEIMPFHCEFCNKSFRYKHHLKAHFGTHHKHEIEEDNHLQGNQNKCDPLISKK